MRLLSSSSSKKPKYSSTDNGSERYGRRAKLFVCLSFAPFSLLRSVCLAPLSSESEFTESDSDSEREELEAEGDAGGKLMVKFRKRRISDHSDFLGRVLKVH